MKKTKQEKKDLENKLAQEVLKVIEEKKDFSIIKEAYTKYVNHMYSLRKYIINPLPKKINYIYKEYFKLKKEFKK